MGSTNVIKCITKDCSYSEELTEGLGTMWALTIGRIQENPSDRTMLENFFSDISVDIGKALDEGYKLEDISEKILFCDSCKTLRSVQTWECRKDNTIVSSIHNCEKCKCELKPVEVEMLPVENKLETDFKVVIKNKRKKINYKCPRCCNEIFKITNMIMWD